MNYFEKKRIRKLAKKLRESYKNDEFNYFDFCKLCNDLRIKINCHYDGAPHTIQKVDDGYHQYWVDFYNPREEEFDDIKIEYLKIVYLCIHAVDEKNKSFEVYRNPESRQPGDAALIDEAEYFALNFLLPKKRFLKHIENQTKEIQAIDFEALASVYKLSISTVRSRAKTLEII